MTRGTVLPALLAGFLGSCAAAGASVDQAPDAGRDADAGFEVVADAAGDADASEVVEDSGERDADAPDVDAATEPMDGGSMDGGPMDGGPMDGGPMDSGPMDSGPMDGGRDAGPDAEPEDASSDAEPEDAALDGGPADAAADARLDAEPEDAALDGGRADAAEGSPDGSVPPEDAGAADAGMAMDAAPEPEPESPCVPGVYKGTFEGELSVRILLVSWNLFDIAGEIEITVEAEAGGDVLRIENGRIEGSDEDGNPLVADVSGTLNCETLQLEDGKLTNGLYVREAFDMEVEFDGVVEATYEPGEVPRVVGTWDTDGERESGEGTFEATLERPAP